METKYELTHMELIEVFKRWVADYSASKQNYKTDVNKMDAVKQATMFADYLKQIQSDTK